MDLGGCTNDGSGDSPPPDSDQQGSQVVETMCTEWTDEKHSLYLKSMEASFVDQLYNSMDSLHLQLKNEISNIHNPSSQFKVLRRGYWQNISFRRSDLRVNTANEDRDFLSSPWIRRFRPSARRLQERAALQNRMTDTNGTTRTVVCSGGTATCLKRSYLCHCRSCRNGSVDINEEVSDQNFVDENVSSDITSSSKKMKTPKIGASIDEQVVPYDKHVMAEDIVGATRDDSPL